MQTNIIVANARALFPNDNAKRMDFINKKLYDKIKSINKNIKIKFNNSLK